MGSLERQRSRVSANFQAQDENLQSLSSCAHGEEGCWGAGAYLQGSADTAWPVWPPVPSVEGPRDSGAALGFSFTGPAGHRGAWRLGGGVMGKASQTAVCLQLHQARLVLPTDSKRHRGALGPTSATPKSLSP